jgi:hypothetical protein
MKTNKSRIRCDLIGIAVAGTLAVSAPVLGMGALEYHNLSTYVGKDEACNFAMNPRAVSELRGVPINDVVRGISYPIFLSFAKGVDMGSKLYSKINCNDERGSK